MEDEVSIFYKNFFLDSNVSPVRTKYNLEEDEP